MQKGIKNIDRLVLLNKNNQLDYLTVCDLVRKIYNSFDFDADNMLDKIESKALVDTFIQQMSVGDTSLSQELLKDLFRKIEIESSGTKTIVEKQLVNVVCNFFGINEPEKRKKLDDLPSPMIRKSASVGRMLARPQSAPNMGYKPPQVTDDETMKILNKIRRIWQQYGVEGNGLMDVVEVKHCVNQLMSDYKGISVVPEPLFKEWFSKLDRDGDGKIDMIEMAHWIKHLFNAMPSKDGGPLREKALGDTIATIKARATAVTV